MLSKKKGLSIWNFASYHGLRTYLVPLDEDKGSVCGEVPSARLSRSLSTLTCVNHINMLSDLWIPTGFWPLGAPAGKWREAWEHGRGIFISCFPPCEVTSAGFVPWWKGDPVKVVCSSQLSFLLGSSNLSLPASLWFKGRVGSAPLLLSWVPALSLKVLSYVPSTPLLSDCL